MIKKYSALGTHRRAFTLMEALISLFIASMLMAALGSSFVVFGNTMTSNKNYLAGVQAARVAMLRMTNAIRTSGACQIGETAPSAGQTGNVTAATLCVTPVDATGVFLTPQAFRYQAYQGLNQLRFYNNATTVYTGDSNIGANSNLLAGTPFGTTANQTVNITKMSFTGELDPGGTGEFINIQVLMVINVGNTSLTVSDSVVPRQQLVIH